MWRSTTLQWDVPETIPWVPVTLEDNFTLFNGVQMTLGQHNVAVVITQLPQRDEVSALERWYNQCVSPSLCEGVGDWKLSRADRGKGCVVWLMDEWTRSM